MKKNILVLLVLCFSLSSHAQEKTMSELFKAMPDSILPYLSENNRLDMIDFMEAKMKAEVTNLLDGKSEMTALTHDSLSITMNDVLSIDMHLMEMPEPVDSSNVVVYVRRTYGVDERQSQVVLDIYSAVWRRLSSTVLSSTLLRRDEDLPQHYTP